jgi:hypothetical protein
VAYKLDYSKVYQSHFEPNNKEIID